MSVKTGADFIVETLQENGADQIVGFIGHSTHAIADAVSKSDLGKSVINPASELGGSHLLNGYNYVKNRAAGVAMWHNVGSLLIHSALQEARSSRIPNVHLGFNSDSRLVNRTESCQQVPWESLVPVTLRTERVERIDLLGDAVMTAFNTAQGVPNGPTFVDIPFDMCYDKMEEKGIVPRGAKKAPRLMQASIEDIREAAKLLLAAKKPVIILGGGVARSEGAGEAVRALIEMVGVPFVTTSTAQGVVSEAHPLAMGPAGMCGWRCANETLHDADFALVIGSRLADWGIAQGYQMKLPKIVHVDNDAAVIGSFYFPEVSIVSDAKLFAEQMVAVLPSTPGFKAMPYQSRESFAKATARRKAWNDWLDAKGRLPEARMWNAMGEVRKIIKPDDYIVGDVGNNSTPVYAGTVLHKPRHFLSSFGEGVLGSGFPMAIGTKLAAPKSTVFLGTGDGAFQYHFNELRIAVEHKLPLVIMLFTNSSYGANHELMRGFFDRGPSWCDFTNPNWVAIAKAYGAEGEALSMGGDVGAALQRAINANKPYIIEIPCTKVEGLASEDLGGVGPKLLLAGREMPVDNAGSVLPGGYLQHSK